MSARPATRDTRQKRAIRAVFERAERPLSTDEILAEAHGTLGRLGLATVYRSIRTLLDDGWLAAVEVPGRTPLYEKSGKRHHHHVVCTTCRRVFELDDCTTSVRGLPAGFRVTSHEVTFYGNCAACAARLPGQD